MLMELGGSEPFYSELVGPTITVPENVKAVAEGRAKVERISLLSTPTVSIYWHGMCRS